ncbi:MAG: hypothetical protein ABIA63_05855, partial [bacterium]
MLKNKQTVFFLFLLAVLFEMCISSPDNICGWLLWSRNKEELKTDYWNKYFDYHKPNAVFTYKYEMPSILDSAALKQEAHVFNDSLVKRGISWYVYSIADVVEKDKLPVTAEDWQAQRDKYQSLFTEFPSVNGIIMNW